MSGSKSYDRQRVFEHTYSPAPKCNENAKTLTGRRVLGQRCKKPSQGEEFWVSSPKNPHREGGFETHTYGRQLIFMLVCMFRKSSACGGIFKLLSLWRVSDC